jgi:hypothetical protein
MDIHESWNRKYEIRVTHTPRRYCIWSPVKTSAKVRLAVGCMVGWFVEAIFDKVNIASIGVAVQSGIPGTLRNSQGDVKIGRGVCPLISHGVSLRHLSELVSGVERMVLRRVCARLGGPGELSDTEFEGAVVSNEQVMDKTSQR